MCGARGAVLACTVFLPLRDANRPSAAYRSVMDFSDSRLADTDEPLRWHRLLVLALVLTAAAVSAGLLASGL